MAIDTTEPTLFFSRTLAHLCAPVFVLLTGLSAWLYGEKHQGRGDVSAFLFKRGLFLVVLEFTLVNFAWTFQLPPITEGATQVRVDAATLASFLAGIDLTAPRRRWFKGRDGSN